MHAGAALGAAADRAWARGRARGRQARACSFKSPLPMASMADAAAWATTPTTACSSSGAQPAWQRAASGPFTASRSSGSGSPAVSQACACAAQRVGGQGQRGAAGRRALRARPGASKRARHAAWVGDISGPRRERAGPSRAAAAQVGPAGARACARTSCMRGMQGSRAACGARGCARGATWMPASVMRCLGSATKMRASRSSASSDSSRSVGRPKSAARAPPAQPSLPGPALKQSGTLHALQGSRFTRTRITTPSLLATLQAQSAGASACAFQFQTIRRVQGHRWDDLCRCIDCHTKSGCIRGGGMQQHAARHQLTAAPSLSSLTLHGGGTKADAGFPPFIIRSRTSSTARTLLASPNCPAAQALSAPLQPAAPPLRWAACWGLPSTLPGRSGAGQAGARRSAGTHGVVLPGFWKAFRCAGTRRVAAAASAGRARRARAPGTGCTAWRTGRRRRSRRWPPRPQ